VNVYYAGGSWTGLIPRYLAVVVLYRLGSFEVRLHDLRHSFASVAASGAQSEVVVGKMLGHSKASTTQQLRHDGEHWPCCA